MQKAIIIIILFSELLFTGCKKDSNQTNPPATPPAFQSYIKFKVDNVPVECNAQISASYLPLIPDTSIWIAGASNIADIRLQVSGNQQLLTTGTYTFNSAKWHSGTIWTKSPGAVRYVAGMDLFLMNYSGSGYVTITEISAQYVKGTFEFITGIDIPTITFKTVTNGEFYVKRNN